jgi:hypothetical protein
VSRSHLFCHKNKFNSFHSHAVVQTTTTASICCFLWRGGTPSGEVTDALLLGGFAEVELLLGLLLEAWVAVRARAVGACNPPPTQEEDSANREDLAPASMWGGGQ